KQRNRDPTRVVSRLGYGYYSMGQRRRAPAARTGNQCHAVIRVSLATLVTIYLLLFLAAVFVFWIVGEWNRRQRERRSLQHRLRCVICAFEFEDRSDALLPRCPHCGSLNERFRM